jgi:hypothetical protein
MTFTFAAPAYNLVRIPNLQAASALAEVCLDGAQNSFRPS